MQSANYIPFALAIGAISAVYLPMNSSVARHLGSPLTASMMFYAVGFVTSIVLFLVFGEFRTIYNIGTVPVYL